MPKNKTINVIEMILAMFELSTVNFIFNGDVIYSSFNKTFITIFSIFENSNFVFELIFSFLFELDISVLSI